MKSWSENTSKINIGSNDETKQTKIRFTNQCRY